MSATFFCLQSKKFFLSGCISIIRYWRVGWLVCVCGVRCSLVLYTVFFWGRMKESACFQFDDFLVLKLVEFGIFLLLYMPPGLFREPTARFNVFRMILLVFKGNINDSIDFKTTLFRVKLSSTKISSHYSQLTDLTESGCSQINPFKNYELFFVSEMMELLC